MTNSIFIGKWVYNQLKENATLKKLVPNKIFPLVAEQTTTFPFIVYWRNNITSDSCKDGFHQDQVSFTVSCVSDNYTQSLQLANECRKSLEGMRYLYDGMTISFCKLTSIDETFQENAFVQMLTFECTVN